MADKEAQNVNSDGGFGGIGILLTCFGFIMWGFFLMATMP